METVVVETPQAQIPQRSEEQIRAQELRESRDILCAAVMGIRHGGGTARFGRVIRETFNLKFDSFVPTDVADILEKESFAREFRASLNTWINSWSADVSESTKTIREREAKACESFVADNGHSRVASAIRNLVKHRAYTWSESTGKNDFPQSLAGACHQLLGIGITVARRRKMQTTF